MENVDLVVKIPKEEYDLIVNDEACGLNVLTRAIANGKKLPKGHGKIGDLDALREEVSSWGMNDYEPSDFIDVIDQADTIIEADKE